MAMTPHRSPWLARARTSWARVLLWLAAAALAPAAAAQTAAAVRAAADQQQAAVLETLKTLVGIESGSRDVEGLTRIAELAAARLLAAGMTVEVLPSRPPGFDPRARGSERGPMVRGTLRGTGERKVLLIAHLDTVYPRGMGEKQPFRVEGDRAYGLGISDDKGGVALVLHTVELLRVLGHTGFAELGVLLNADEEIGSAGSAALLTQLGSEYDAVLSFEGGGVDIDAVRLATSSTASVELRVTGRASHAGANPEGGRNALVELAHQILKTRDYGEPGVGLKINWTIARSGEVGNVIPALAMAHGDVRAENAADLDRLEARLAEAARDRLIPDTTVEMRMRRGRPAFRANAASRALAVHAQAVFGEIGRTLDVRERSAGGGTDAAYAAMRARGGVLEGFGLRGAGSHSNDREYIFVSSIVPRLYLATRMVMDIGAGKVSW